MKKSVKIDLYIADAGDFARPILEAIRAIIHKACPEIQEDWKWNAPNFNDQGMVCWLAAFKEHVGINFFKGSLIVDKYNWFDQEGAEGKGNRMIRIRALQEIDENKLIYYFREGAAVNRKGLKVQIEKKLLDIPEFVLEALKKDETLHSNFSKFTITQKNEYIEWLVSAKQEKTREKRMEDFRAWVKEGKVRNWKYLNC